MNFIAQKCVFPFIYKLISYNTCIQIDFGYNWCSPNAIYNGQIIACDPIEKAFNTTCDGSPINSNKYNLTNPLSRYNMLFTTGQNQLPTVDSVSNNNLALNDLISIKGSGFSLIQCENQVLINGFECEIFNFTQNQLNCYLNNSTSLQPNIAYNIEVLVKNIGFALKTSFLQIKFLPVITSFEPKIGSLSGGTNLNISGIGFIPQTTIIQIGQNYYYNNDGQNTNIAYNLISLNTYPDLNGNQTILIQSNNIQAVCLVNNNNCNFTFSQIDTPIINDVVPTMVNASSLITLTGSNFGQDINNVNVYIGSQYCQPVQINETQIVCQLNGLNLGGQNIQVNILGINNFELFYKIIEH